MGILFPTMKGTSFSKIYCHTKFQSLHSMVVVLLHVSNSQDDHVNNADQTDLRSIRQERYPVT
jgi:hypothetical protein